jgi:hypothetical protein
MLRTRHELSHQIFIRKIIVTRNNLSVFDDEFYRSSVVGCDGQKLSISDETNQTARPVNVFRDNDLLRLRFSVINCLFVDENFSFFVTNVLSRRLQLAFGIENLFQNYLADCVVK